MQIAFEAPSKLVSTEKFVAPYVLEGEVWAYNQRMLERFEIRSLLLLFCVEAGLPAGALRLAEGWSITDCW